MINILALLKSQPITGLESNSIALIKGFSPKTAIKWRDPSIWFLEPPAGQHIPFINPIEAMEVLFRHQGTEHTEATHKAVIEYAELRLRLDIFQRVRFFDSLESESPECIPASLLLAYLQEKHLVMTDIIDYLIRAVEVVTCTSNFQGSENWNEPWALAELPELPTARSMIEFVPGVPWGVCMDEVDQTVNAPFTPWREEMRSIADCLEKSLGESVYYFRDLECEYDDDNIHRFLVLHWCCTFQPESPYVKFLIEVSGAKDVEELKAALIDPKSYFHPYKMNDVFRGLEANICRFDYIPPETPKTIGIVFSTVAAKSWATSLLLQKINADVFILAPKELVPDDWVTMSTRNCSDWTVRYLQDGQLNDPIEVLARIDELCVIADEKSTGQGFNLNIPSSIEDLLWLALSYQFPTTFFYINGSSLFNPESRLQACKVPERVAKQNKLRENETLQLTELRIMADFGSSGLWNDEGRMISYDLIFLPFQLVRRLSAWQRDYDDTFNPPEPGDETWWDNHKREKNEIAKALQATLGSNTHVKVYLDEQWQWIGDIQLISFNQS